jgi:hypothetical protein
MTYVGKSCFILNLAFKVEPFQLVHPKWPSFLKFVLDAYGECIYIAHHLEIMTNNMGQIFEREQHFHVHTTLEH